MLARQKQRIEAYRRVKDFLDRHRMPESPGYLKQKRAFDEVVANLDAHAIDQGAGRRLGSAGVARRDALCRSLREGHLRPIARIARDELVGAPGIEQALRMPDYYLGPTKLIAEARAMRRAAELYEDRFIQAGRPTDFLEQLDEAIEEVRSSANAKEQSVRRQVGATAGLEQEIRRGRRLVDILDTIVKHAFGGDEPTLAEWRAAKRVEARPGGRAAATSDGHDLASAQPG